MTDRQSLSFPQATDSAEYPAPSPPNGVPIKSEVNFEQEMETDFLIETESEDTFQLDYDPDYLPPSTCHSTQEKNNVSINHF